MIGSLKNHVGQKFIICHSTYLQSIKQDEINNNPRKSEWIFIIFKWMRIFRTWYSNRLSKSKLENTFQFQHLPRKKKFSQKLRNFCLRWSIFCQTESCMLNDLAQFCESKINCKLTKLHFYKCHFILSFIESKIYPEIMRKEMFFSVYEEGKLWHSIIISTR